MPNNSREGGKEGQKHHKNGKPFAHKNLQHNFLNGRGLKVFFVRSRMPINSRLGGKEGQTNIKKEGLKG